MTLGLRTLQFKKNPSRHSRLVSLNIDETMLFTIFLKYCSWKSCPKYFVLFFFLLNQKIITYNKLNIGI